MGVAPQPPQRDIHTNTSFSPTTTTPQQWLIN